MVKDDGQGSLLPPLQFMVGIQDPEYRKTKIGFRAKFLPEIIAKFTSEYSNWREIRSDPDKLVRSSRTSGESVIIQLEPRSCTACECILSVLSTHSLKH
jgi:hypothetical protein